MYLFKYKGFDVTKGKKVNGYLEAYTREEVAYKLNEDGIECTIDDIYEVDTQSFEYKKDMILNKSLSNTLSQKQILTFTEQLSMHLSAKLPVSESLGSMAKDSSNKALASLYKSLYEDTVKGLDLSEALKKHKGFDDFFITIVKSGEQSGQLDECLNSLNQYIKTNQQLKSRLISAAIYPMFLIAVIIAGLILISVFLVPRFQDIFANAEAELNIFTKFYFALADFIRYNPIIFFGGFALILLLIVFYMRTQIPVIVKFRDYVQLKNPIYNKFLKDRDIALFSYTLSILLKNGIILTDALEMSKGMFKNQMVLEGLNVIHKNLLQGSPLSKELKEFRIMKKQFLPSLFIQLATVGDSTGNLEEPFSKVGEYFFTMFDNKSRSFEKLMEPMLILILVPVVFSFVLAIYLPMLTLSSAL